MFGETGLVDSTARSTAAAAASVFNPIPGPQKTSGTTTTEADDAVYIIFPIPNLIGDFVFLVVLLLLLLVGRRFGLSYMRRHGDASEPPKWPRRRKIIHLLLGCTDCCFGGGEE